MFRTMICSILAVLGLFAATPSANAQVMTFPGIRSGYQPNFAYQYGYGVYPSYYYNPGQQYPPIIRPTVQVYVIEYRRPDWHFWQTFGRTYSVREAQYYANYLRSLGFAARVHLHPL